MHCTITDLFDTRLFRQMADDGFIRTATCADSGLHIYNYTETAQYQGVWNEVTRTCRGLIVDPAGRVVARPFAKFFNFGEPNGGGGDGPVVVTDKLDGSLGILYPVGSTWRIATRGSFTSEQAVHGTRLLADRYPSFRPNTAWTYLFEIIYPQNRIVVDYGNTDDLVLIGGVETSTGRSVPLDQVAATWPGPTVEVFDFPDIVAALDAPARENREGLVVHFLNSDVRVKVKYAEYVRMHRIVTGLSTTVVFDHLKSGRPIAELLVNIPDEFYDTICAVADELLSRRDALVAAINEHYATVSGAHDPVGERKAFAQAVLALDFDLKHTLFSLADRGHIDETKVWDHIRPTYRRLGALGGES